MRKCFLVIALYYPLVNPKSKRRVANDWKVCDSVERSQMPRTTKERKGCGRRGSCRHHILPIFTFPACMARACPPPMVDYNTDPSLPQRNTILRSCRKTPLAMAGISLLTLLSGRARWGGKGGRTTRLTRESGTLPGYRPPEHAIVPVRLASGHWGLSLFLRSL